MCYEFGNPLVIHTKITDSQTRFGMQFEARPIILCTIGLEEEIVGEEHECSVEDCMEFGSVIEDDSSSRLIFHPSDYCRAQSLW